MRVLNRLLWAVSVVAAVWSCSANANIKPLNESRYQVYYGDMDSEEFGLDGYPDILLRARKNYVLIAASVTFPIPLDSGYQDIFLCGSANGTFSVCSLNPGADTPSNPSDQFDLLLSDFDGSGDLDIFIHAKDQNTNSLVATNQGDGSFSLADQFVDINGHRVSGAGVNISNRYGDALRSEFSFADAQYAELANDDFVIKNRPVDGGGDGLLIRSPLSASLVGLDQANAGVSNSGAFQYSLPIQLPPGVNGHQPSLSVQYNSLSASGNLGAGANLSGLSVIRRCGSTIASGDDYTSLASLSNEDRLCLNGARLILVSGSYWTSGSEYRFENGGNRKVVQSGVGQDSIYIVKHPDGREDDYGFAFSPLGADLPLVWAITTSEDAFGNTISYEYDRAKTGFLPRYIRYGHNNDVVVELISDPHEDGRSAYIGGGFYENSHALSMVKVSAAANNAFEYRFSYGENPYGKNGRLALKSVQQCGFEQGARRCAPATRLGWSEKRFGFDVSHSEEWLDKPETVVSSAAMDWNGDGYSNIIMADKQRVYGWFEEGGRSTLYTPPSGYEVYSIGKGRRFSSGAQSLLINIGKIDTGSGKWYVRWYEVSAANNSATVIESLSGNLSQSIAQLMSPHRAARPLVLDYQGNGYVDVLLWYPSGWRLYSANDSETAGYSRIRTISTSVLPAKAQPFVADISGDGFAEIVYKSATNNDFRAVKIGRSGSASSLGVLEDESGVVIDGKFTVWGDFNGDGFVDLVSGLETSLNLYLNMGNGKYRKKQLGSQSSVFFIEGQQFEGVRPNQYYIQAVDYDGDSRDDLVFYNPESQDGEFKVAIFNGQDFNAPESTGVQSWLRPTIGQVSYSYTTELPKPEMGTLSPSSLQQILRYSLYAVSNQMRINYADGTLTGQAMVLYSDASQCGSWTLPPHLNCQVSSGNVYLTFDLRDAHHYWSYDVDYIDVHGTLVPLLSNWLGEMQARGTSGGLIPELPWGWPSSVYSLSSSGTVIEDCLSGLSTYAEACNFLAQWAGLNMTAGFYLYEYGPSDTTTTSGHIQVPLGMADWLHADLNADGAVDMIAPGDSPDALRTYENQYRAPLVTKVTNGLGAETQIAYGVGDTLDYLHDEDAPAVAGAFHYRQGRPLAHKLTLPNGQSGIVTEYQYRNSLLDRHGRGWLGFSDVKEYNLTRESSAEKTVHQAWPYTGRVVEKTVSLFDGTMLSRASTKWLSADIGENISHVYPEETIQATFNDNGSLISASVAEKNVELFEGEIFQVALEGYKTYSDLDSEGEPTELLHEKIVDYQYTHRLDSWLLGFVSGKDITFTRIENGITKTRANKEEYLPYSSSNKVRVKKIYNGSESPTELYQTMTYAYNGKGVKTLEKVSAANAHGDIVTREQRVQGLIRGRFPAKEVNALGYGDQANRAYDLRFGAMVKRTDENGLVTRHEYDPLGRRTKTIHPDGSESGSVYTACTEVDCAGMVEAAYYISQSLIHPQSTSEGSPASYVFYDALNREVGTETVAYDGRLIRTRKGYDPLGRLLVTETPHYQGESGELTTYSYDALDRKRGIQAASGSVVSYDYTVTAGQGISIETTNDFISDLGDLKQVKRVEKYNALNELVESVDDASGEQVTTRYGYDPYGNLVLSEVVGNSSEMTQAFDLLSNLLHVSDPDQGEISYVYNGFGERIEETKENGAKRNLFYDLLGRKIEEGSISPDGAQEVRRWVYDLDENNACAEDGYSRKYGQLACRIGPGFREEYGYDAFARVDQVDTSLTNRSGDERSYAQSYDYDNYSRIKSRVFPNNYTVQNEHNVYGYLAAYFDGDNKELYRVNSQDAWQNITDAFLSNGNIQQASAYNSATGRIASRLSSANGQALQDEVYRWWSHGALQSRQQLTSSGALTEVFSYDGLNRLEKAQSSGAVTRTENVTYDKLGNIQNKYGVGAYTYEAQQPHAVSHADGVNYQYDASGNMIRRGNASVHYTSFGKPSHFLVDGSEHIRFSYGPDQARYYQWRQTSAGQSEEVFYLNGYEEVVRQGNVKQRAYVGNILVANAEQVGGGEPVIQEHYLLRDHLGSVQVIADADGNVLERLLYDPWGKPRKASGLDDGSGSTVQDRGFTDHEHLAELGLIHMNGRIYDPKIGRFLSPDPVVQSPFFSQNYNRYSYVLNGPLFYTDPSGYCVYEIPCPDVMRYAIDGSFYTYSSIRDGYKSYRDFKLHNPYESKINIFDAYVMTGLGAGFKSWGFEAEFDIIKAKKDLRSGVLTGEQGLQLGWGVKTAGVTIFDYSRSGLPRSSLANGDVALLDKKFRFERPGIYWSPKKMSPPRSGREFSNYGDIVPEFMGKNYAGDDMKIEFGGYFLVGASVGFNGSEFFRWGGYQKDAIGYALDAFESSMTNAELSGSSIGY